MDDIAEILSQNIKRLREAKGWRQVDLAEAMGVSLGTIQGYEGKRRWPELPYVIAMAKTLDVHVSELFYSPKDNAPEELQEVINNWHNLRSGTKEVIAMIVKNEITQGLSQKKTSANE